MFSLSVVFSKVLGQVSRPSLQQATFNLLKGPNVASITTKAKQLVVQTDACLYRNSLLPNSTRAGIGVYFGPGHPDNVSVPVPAWQLTHKTALSEVKKKAATMAVLFGGWQRNALSTNGRNPNVVVLTDCIQSLCDLSETYKDYTWLQFSLVTSDLITGADFLAEQAVKNCGVMNKLL